MAKGFKHGAGGGTSLNFKVVGGTSAPSNLKENTTWVNTDIDIHAWDFSATEPHRRSNNKNLIVYPYLWTQTGSQSGITYTVNSDGTISANGTASANAYCHVSNTGIARGEIILESGAYTLSGCSGGGSNYALNIAYSYDNWATNLQKRVASGSTTFTIDKPAKARFYINIYSGTTVSNLVFKPQLEKGSTATSFVKGDATGQVWITTGTSSTAPFNALKKNGIQVYPISAKQYVNGAWVTKPLEIYQNGQWVDFGATIYDSGTFNSAYATTLVAKGAKALSTSGSTDTNPTINYNSSNISLSQASGWKAGIAYFDKKIDLTHYGTVTLDVNGKTVSDGAGPTFYCWESVPTYFSEESVALIGCKTDSTRKTITLDISSLSGSYYLGFGIGSGGSEAAQMTLYKLRLD